MLHDNLDQILDNFKSSGITELVKKPLPELIKEFVKDEGCLHYKNLLYLAISERCIDKSISSFYKNYPVIARWAKANEYKASLNDWERILLSLAFVYNKNFSDIADYERAFNYVANGNQTNSLILYRQGYMIQRGIGKPASTPLALEYYRCAAPTCGSAGAELGYLFLYASDVAKNEKEGLENLVSSVQLGDFYALHTLGDYYYLKKCFLEAARCWALIVDIFPRAKQNLHNLSKVNAKDKVFLFRLFHGGFLPQNFITEIKDLSTIKESIHQHIRDLPLEIRLLTLMASLKPDKPLGQLMWQPTGVTATSLGKGTLKDLVKTLISSSEEAFKATSNEQLTLEVKFEKLNKLLPFVTWCVVNKEKHKLEVDELAAKLGTKINIIAQQLQSELRAPTVNPGWILPLSQPPEPTGPFYMINPITGETYMTDTLPVYPSYYAEGSPGLIANASAPAAVQIENYIIPSAENFQLPAPKPTSIYHPAGPAFYSANANFQSILDMPIPTPSNSMAGPNWR